MPERKILINDIRVRGIGKSDIPEENDVPTADAEAVVAEVTKSTHIFLQIRWVHMIKII